MRLLPHLLLELRPLQLLLLLLPLRLPGELLPVGIRRTTPFYSRGICCSSNRGRRRRPWSPSKGPSLPSTLLLLL